MQTDQQIRCQTHPISVSCCILFVYPFDKQDEPGPNHFGKDYMQPSNSNPFTMEIKPKMTF